MVLFQSLLIQSYIERSVNSSWVWSFAHTRFPIMNNTVRVSSSSATAISVRITNNQCNVIPNIGQMINANWDSSDLGLAFVVARRGVKGVEC